MQGAGTALMGVSAARGEDRALVAAEGAISSPLLEATMEGAHGVLLSIAGGSNLGIKEVEIAARLVREAAHPEANIIFGTIIDDALGDELRITVIAAGFDGGAPTTRKHEGALGGFENAAPAPAADELEPVVAPTETSTVPQAVEADVDTDAIDISATRTTRETLDVPEFLR
jgi:cell division protein FtsZ